MQKTLEIVQDSENQLKKYNESLMERLSEKTNENQNVKQEVNIVKENILNLQSEARKLKKNIKLIKVIILIIIKFK